MHLTRSCALAPHSPSPFQQQERTHVIIFHAPSIRCVRVRVLFVCVFCLCACLFVCVFWCDIAQDVRAALRLLSGDGSGSSSREEADNGSSDPVMSERALRATDLKSSHSLIQLLQPLTTHNFENLGLHCNGFCPVTFVDTGAVVPVCRHIGLLQFGNAFYGFLSRDAALKFAADPEGVVTRLLDVARRRIEVPELLRLHGALAARQDVTAISQGAC